MALESERCSPSSASSPGPQANQRPGSNGGSSSATTPAPAPDSIKRPEETIVPKTELVDDMPLSPPPPHRTSTSPDLVHVMAHPRPLLPATRSFLDDAAFLSRFPGVALRVPPRPFDAAAMVAAHRSAFSLGRSPYMPLGYPGDMFPAGSPVGPPLLPMSVPLPVQLPPMAPSSVVLRPQPQPPTPPTGAHPILPFSVDNILRPEFGRTAVERKGSPTLPSAKPSKKARPAIPAATPPGPGAVAVTPPASTAAALPRDPPRLLCPPSPAKSVASDVTSTSDDASKTDSADDKSNIMWPAWVYCTRYSDRPSSGEQPFHFITTSQRIILSNRMLAAWLSPAGSAGTTPTKANPLLV